MVVEGNLEGKCSHQRGKEKTWLPLYKKTLDVGSNRDGQDQVAVPYAKHVKNIPSIYLFVATLLTKSYL